VIQILLSGPSEKSDTCVRTHSMKIEVEIFYTYPRVPCDNRICVAIFKNNRIPTRQNTSVFVPYAVEDIDSEGQVVGQSHCNEVFL
jgi:hypothetical protein